MMAPAIGRRKSCVPCRISKARCSLGSPCRRCEERGLDCKFDNLQRRPAAYRVLRQGVKNTDKDNGHETQTRLGSTSTPLTCSGNDTAGFLFENQVDQLPESSTDWGALVPHMMPQNSPGHDLSLPTQLFQEIPDLLSSMRFDSSHNPMALSDLSGFPMLQDQQLNEPDNQRACVSLQSPGLLSNTAMTSLSKRIDDSYPKPTRPFYRVKPLIPRVNKTTSGCLTAKVLLGQLLSYPAMIAKGSRLPPFIFPPCAIDELGLSADCFAKGYHQCLPEALAICCSLVQSFEARTPGSVPFVWKSIYGEVGRLRKEFTSYDSEGLLQALQATVIYVLLQASDQHPTHDDNVIMLLSTPILIAQRLHQSCDFHSNLIKSTRINRRDWLLRESIRRTISLLFGIELLVDVNFNAMEMEDRCGYNQLPLPSVRELWENVSSAEWTARYKKLQAGSRHNRVLSIQDLRQTKRPSEVQVNDQSDEGQVLKQVYEWCENLDEFGMMVWMAVMLE